MMRSASYGLTLGWLLFGCGTTPPCLSNTTKQGTLTPSNSSGAYPRAEAERSYYNWALTVCLGMSAAAETDQHDAKASAAAYLEQGEVGLELYEEMAELAAAYVNRKYSGSIPGEFKIKKCIDLYESNELGALIRKATARSSGSTGE